MNLIKLKGLKDEQAYEDVGKRTSKYCGEGVLRSRWV